MLTDNDNSGLFTFLIGVIVLVMCGVGLSVVVDKRFKFSSGAGEIRQDIVADAVVIEELIIQKEEAEQLLRSSGSKLQTGPGDHREVSARLESLRQRQAALEKSRVQLSESIAAVEGEFSHYRETYRQKTWGGAIGESLGTLSIHGGRVYQKSFITRVTDVGLEIRHEHGIARIQAPDLDPKMQDRFQWSDEERRRLLKQETENQLGSSGLDESPTAGGEPAVFEPAPVSPAKPVKRTPTKPAEDTEKVRLLRMQVAGWRGKVSRLRSDRAEASSRASYGNQSSVPGSLETWAARSARLGRELNQAQAALTVAKVELAAVAPYDPLLIEPELDQ